MTMNMKKYDFRLDSIVAHKISLDTLGAPQIPAIDQESAGFYRIKCMVCFDENGHGSGVPMLVSCGDESAVTYRIEWNGNLTNQHRKNHKQPQATEYAACGIALLLVPEVTEYTAVEMSAIGTTVDYYLKKPERADDLLIFNDSARLEVSGILREPSSGAVARRVKEKMDRLKPDPNGSMLTFIVVVEFSRPFCRVVLV